MALSWDLVVVGGGPAGSSTALHLVRKEGIDPSRVLVLDKARFPREKPCAGAISTHGVDVLAAIGIPIEVPSVPMKGVRVIAGDAAGETMAPMGVVVRRSELDASLLARAGREGVVVREGDGVRALDRIAGGFRLTTSSGEEVTTRLVAACDGAGSTTRKLLGLREPDRKGHLYVLETDPVAADSGVERGLVDFDLSVVGEGVEGYYWDFPTIIDGREQVSRGIYHANLTPSSEVKAVLGRALAKRGIDIERVKLKPFSTRPFVPGSVTWMPGAVLVGEAAGIDQTTGEGIAQAIAMGAIAARHLARALRTGGDAFPAYDREVRRSTFGRHLLESAWLARRVYAPIGEPARRFLVRSDHARSTAIRWYRGEDLSFTAQALMGLDMLRDITAVAAVRASRVSL